MPQTEPKEFKIIQEACASLATYGLFLFFMVWIALWHAPIWPYAVVFGLILSFMIKIDIKHMILPDSLNIILLISGLTSHYLIYGNILFSILGALFGFLLFFAIFYITYKIKGEPSMGFGDVKFITALGAWVGITGIPLILLWASLFAGIYIIFKMILSKKFTDKPFPFGPYLAVAGWVTFLYSTWSWTVILNVREKLLGIF
jgi:leader peptidase (prepilin peptidase)/N-methyltransferase